VRGFQQELHRLQPDSRMGPYGGQRLGQRLPLPHHQRQRQHGTRHSESVSQFVPPAVGADEGPHHGAVPGCPVLEV